MSETNYCKDCLNMNCPEGRVNCIYQDAIACHLYTNTPPTVFEEIIASKEALASKLVYSWELVYSDDWGTKKQKLNGFLRCVMVWLFVVKLKQSQQLCMS